MSIAAFGEASPFFPASGAGTDGISAPKVFIVPEEAGDKVSALSVLGFVDGPKRRSAISAAMDDGGANSFATGAAAGSGRDFGEPLPRAIPCEASTFSTTRAIAARSTPPADAAGAAGCFSSGFASGEGASPLGADAGTAGTLTFS